MQREQEIANYLSKKLGDAWRIPRYLADKSDFGDMDVLIASRPDWESVRADIVNDLSITQTIAVGHVYSTVYQGLQTDFFTVPLAYLDSTANFMAFNDLGNLLGRICRRFDLKYGERGLSYVYRRAQGNYQCDLEISTDMAVICDFLGLDHALWLAGFSNKIQMFEWLIKSPFFSSRPYEDELQGSLKTRQNRPIVQAFISYLQQQKIQRHPDFLERAEYLPMLLQRFPNLIAQLEQERAREAQVQQLSSKFSGQLVMQLRPELTGAKLGQFIQALKAGKPDFEAFILNSDEVQIRQYINDFASSSSVD